MSEKNGFRRWYDKPFLGQYSIVDFIRTGMALIFIALCVSFIFLYIHQQIDFSSKRDMLIEYVNMQRDDIVDPDNHLILKAPDLVIDKILEFPITYNKLDIYGYILLDTETSGRYLFLRSGDGTRMAITKYWSERELLHLRELHTHLQIEQEIPRMLEKEDLIDDTEQEPEDRSIR